VYALLSLNRYVDGLGLCFGALIGANSLTVYIESVTGILEGGRTGLSACFTAFLFFISTVVLAPFFSIIPNSATVCALIIVGCMSMESLQGIDWTNFKVRLSFTHSHPYTHYTIAPICVDDSHLPLPLCCVLIE
jgi:xanthine/uracil/vitamin C permease (AzgA family)